MWLKLGRVHPEALHEADGLRAWDGNGAVRIIDEVRDDATYALLLEECVPGVQLREALPEDEQDVVIARLLRRLWIEPPRHPERSRGTWAGVRRATRAPGSLDDARDDSAERHPFRPLSEMCDAWAEGRNDEGAAMWRELARSGERTVLLHTDLHAGNVLSSQREPWLAIDPKPYVGDPHYDVLQHMLNCPARLAADPNGFCDRMASLAELDAKRVRQWLFARLIVDPDMAGPTIARMLKR